MRGKTYRRLIPPLLGIMVVAAVLVLGVVVKSAPPVATVSIDLPGNGDTVAGTIDVVVSYEIDKGSVHTIQIMAAGEVAASAAVHKKNGTQTFQLYMRT